MENDVGRMIIEYMSPHMAREIRRREGSPKGDLKCIACGSMNASNNRQRTNYANSDNMQTLCPPCQDEADAYWDDMWSNVEGY